MIDEDKILSQDVEVMDTCHKARWKDGSLMGYEMWNYEFLG